ncbi:3-methylcrotonyl-CoA carboxylase alpha subunit [Fistulifera solaris]|uniref:3-methylcrotonyl-CoA carboxylase alpha subunit n=1 Tax=Fistulifera solaris TaxID=1519565 RepID=A0A1Z5JVJ5_FISSO|nr:3-methylcrotonyl-CoA carboxylase alpha subunit [Fistulifera solaris]|eukprot:GAX18057.1 3-methylcrotonyl-CoA carboxylase alpha subunit [Fistulifera solaris]
MLRRSLSRLNSAARRAFSSTLLRKKERPNISSVLIANRGEIAHRIVRTLNKWDIESHTVHSCVDPPVQGSNYTHPIGTGPQSSESYLLGEKYIDLCVQHNIQAIHPGYGFLSESSAFAQAVIDAGLTWIGPSPHSMHLMASKSVAKQIMLDRGVPVTPSYHNDENQSYEHLLQEAREIGFPVLIKAVMGGGGKGMRIVRHEKEFLSSLQACQREAAASFKNDIVLLEKYLEQPKHVEVQILADSHGTTLALAERDCSLQRRHQKIIEEAPASYLSDEIRQDLWHAAVQAAEAVNYVNAGTIEFLLDSDLKSFYFCEMNTRLQVEHPVTEMITGLDLVEQQLRVAAGERLAFSQEDVVCRGHAFEARVYAENPAQQFLPAAGDMWYCQTPQDGSRVDHIPNHPHVSVFYDPMISKVIVHGEDRDQALKKLVQSLQQYHVAGVPTNLEFLLKCAKHPVFSASAAQVHTGFLADHPLQEELAAKHASPSALSQAMGACAVQLWLEQRLESFDDTWTSQPWSSRSGTWRLGGQLPVRKLPWIQDTSISCSYQPDGSYQMTLEDGTSYHIRVSKINTGSRNELHFVVNDSIHWTALTALSMPTHDCIHVCLWPKNHPTDFLWEFKVPHPYMYRNTDGEAKALHSGQIKSPMPGTLRTVECQVGQTVHKGQTLVVMEAMKMEHALVAPFDGKVTQVWSLAAKTVPDGAVLVTLEPTESTGVDGGVTPETNFAVQ